MTAKEKAIVKLAMEVLEQASVGGVGPDGDSLEELEEQWDKGKCAGNDAYYETCQHAWLLLNKLNEPTQMPQANDTDPMVFRNYKPVPHSWQGGST